MKALVCESCLRNMSPLIEFRVIDKGRKSKKHRQKTLELPDRFDNPYKQIEDIERWFKTKMSGGWLSDTEIKVKSIKIGRRDFQL